jgi:hypothetical protein
MATDNPITEPADLFYGATESEELEEPTEEEAVTNGDDQDTEETEQTDQPLEDEEESKDESEEEGEEEDADSEDDDAEDSGEELVYLDLDGKEVDLDEVRKWRDGHLMQADYTRKTQEVADDRKAVQAEREEVTTLKSQINEQLAELKAMVELDEEIDWVELRETDPDEYIERKEKADKRKAAVEKFKAEPEDSPLTPDELKEEQSTLFGGHPDWFDDKGKTTKTYTDDMEALNSYCKNAGFTEAEVKGMPRARYIETLLKAAKYDELQERGKEVKKRVKKATLVTKPKAQARKVNKKPKALEDVFYNS